MISVISALERPPYEVSECGWGEFEIVAKIHFIDPNERPVELRHWLRVRHRTFSFADIIFQLYPPGVEDYERYRAPEGTANCVATEVRLSHR